jgi:hypothetical protein
MKTYISLNIIDLSGNNINIKDEQPPLQERASYFLPSLKVEVTPVNEEENAE